MEEVKLAVLVAAFVLSLLSFGFTMWTAWRAKQSQMISNLLGSKETIAFAALKVLRGGLPALRKDRELLIASIVQACVFSSSDRARALLYRAIEMNRQLYLDELRSAMTSIKATFDAMERYSFDDTDLDLGRGRQRIAALERVVEQK